MTRLRPTAILRTVSGCTRLSQVLMLLQPVFDLSYLPYSPIRKWRIKFTRDTKPELIAWAFFTGAWV